MADQFDTWNKLLAIKARCGTKADFRKAIEAEKIIIDVNEPCSGYFRASAVRNGPLLPVAIWRDDDGKLFVMRGVDDFIDQGRVWPHCVWSPVTYDAYLAVIEGGKWSDEDAMVTDQQADDAQASRSNNPPEEDEATALKQQIDNAAGAADKDYVKIDSDEAAARAQSMRSRLLELSGKATKKHDVEKAPHWEKCKEIDAKWNPMAALAKAAADKIRKALEDWSDKKREIARKAEAAAAKLAADAAAAELAKNPPTAEVVTLAQPQPQQPAPLSEASTTIKGASGRSARVGVRKVAVIVDQDAAYQALKAIPELKDVIQKIAQRFVDNGQEVAGVDVVEKSKVA